MGDAHRGHQDELQGPDDGAARDRPLHKDRRRREGAQGEIQDAVLRVP